MQTLKQRHYFVWWALLLCLTAMSARAEQKIQLGNWDVHYMVVNTAFLNPDVAKNYGIVRSKYSALINVSVLDHTSQQAQNVAVMGTATNLLGNAKELAFQKVEEGPAIYYLAEVTFTDRETLRFAIDIQQGNEIRTLKFQQQMFVDD
ncbi:DUF4426 domain-containing protein [Alteromonas aestuariivivens]|uniref:DUF4426 domain-containing protein n=1 Tax=Alteromonas aestuariivivens TaxID=1938339 RepID=A0A3D8MDW7_9ALTE|nr:DUF4426 domain-containing protein [Alteromonas aestuariivivens]RDV29037.1 DUF4426 domain-containing protein [Alteromonas aestuariivivens]